MNATATNSDVKQPPLSPALLIVITSILLGIGARGVSLSYAPEHSYRPDHMDFLAWSEEAWRSGPTKIYHRDKAWAINYRFRTPDGRWQDAPARIPHACNYLPGSSYIFWMQGGLWSMLDKEVTLQGFGGQTGVPRGKEITGRVANTYTARFVGAFPSIVFDFLLAWGVYALVMALGGSSPRAAFGFALVMLAPPIFLDSAFWNQADAWVGAPMVWTLVWVIRRNYLLAGIIYGLALILKPQAILLGPVLIFAGLVNLLRESPRAALGPILTGVIAVVVAFVLTIPHSLSGRGIENLSEEDKSWQSLLWFKRGYVDTVTGDLYPRTTLNAFNIWWLDYQSNLKAELKQSGVAETDRNYGRVYAQARAKAWDSTAKIFGMSKDAFGKGLLAVSLLVGGFLVGRRWKWEPLTILGFAFVVMLCAFLLPTRVHERYIFLCLPFVLALGVLRPRWLLIAAPLVIVGTFEMTSFLWANKPANAGSATTLAWVACLAGVGTIALLLLPDNPARPPAKAKDA